jgi:ferric-dicitrate binding protein FerR (iron transport regulator)
VKPELIEKFFRKECTPQEAKQVALYLKANPRVLEKYISIKKWKTTGKELMPEDFWNEAWENIQQKNRQRHLVVTIKRVTAVAASLIIVASVIYYFYPSAKTIQQPVVTAQLQPKAKRKSVINTGNKILNIVLQDSSVIKLSPASTVQYDEPFPENKRDIFLDGEAEFHVTKNKKKPFTVYAGAFATTALGTIFSVKKNADKNIINVKLFQGKVVIHATDNIQGWKDDVYLLAGEQMKFNTQTSLLTVDKINNINNTLANNIIKTKKPVEDSFSGQLNFSNTLLPEVMQKLSAVYKVKIQYDSLAIDSIRFTGAISKTDSLSVILKAITQMNNLDVIKNNDEFIISKHQQ